MEKLLYESKCLNGWGFRGMKFSENINGWTFHKPSIELTFSSNICTIPDRLLPSRACFRLYRCYKNNTMNSIIENNLKNGIWLRKILKCYYFLRPKNYLLKSVSKLRRSIMLITPCKACLDKSRRKRSSGYDDVPGTQELRSSSIRHSRLVNEYNYMNISKTKRNPVRDYLSVEKGHTSSLCIPSGMQPVFRNVVALLRNADITCGYNFLPRDIPYGNVTILYNIDIQRLRLSLTDMVQSATGLRMWKIPIKAVSKVIFNVIARAVVRSNSLIINVMDCLLLPSSHFVMTEIGAFDTVSIRTNFLRRKFTRIHRIMAPQTFLKRKLCL